MCGRGVLFLLLQVVKSPKGHGRSAKNQKRRGDHSVWKMGKKKACHPEQCEKQSDAGLKTGKADA